MIAGIGGELSLAKHGANSGVRGSAARRHAAAPHACTTPGARNPFGESSRFVGLLRLLLRRLLLRLLRLKRRRMLGRGLLLRRGLLVGITLQLRGIALLLLLGIAELLRLRRVGRGRRRRRRPYVAVLRRRWKGPHGRVRGGRVHLRGRVAAGHLGCSWLAGLLRHREEQRRPIGRSERAAAAAGGQQRLRWRAILHGSKQRSSAHLG